MKIIWIVVFLLCNKTESLVLRYGFENQKEELCYSFPINASSSQIILRNSNESTIWNVIKPGSSSHKNNKSTSTINLRHYFVNNSLQLCFSNLSKSDIGNYSLEEVLYKTCFNFSIDVEYEAKILKIEVDSNVKEYDDVNLTCEVDSNPLANITWILFNEINHRTASDGRNSILSIVNCTCEHTGNYTCIATNNEDNVDKEDLFLNISCGPKFKNTDNFHDAVININVGEILEYSINFTANPSPEIFTDLKSKIVSFDAVNYALFLQKQILNEGDFKAYTISIRNNFGIANLTLNVLQQKFNTSVKRLIILIVTVSTVVLVTVSVSMVMIVKKKKKRKKRKKVYNGDYRENVLYEPAPMDFFSGIQQREIDTMPVKSNEVAKRRTTKIEEEDLLKNDNTATNSSREDQRSTQRRKPVPTSRMNKRVLDTGFQNARYCHEKRNVLKETNANQSLQQVSLSSLAKHNVSLSSGDLQSEDCSLTRFGVQQDRERMEIVSAGTNADDRDELFQSFSAATKNNNRLKKYNEKANQLNYIEVECSVQRKALIDFHGLKQRSDYHIILNDSGVIGPMTSEDNTSFDHDYIDNQDDCSHIAELDHTYENTQGNLIEPEDKGINDQNPLEFAMENSDEQTGLESGTLPDSS